MDKKEPPAGAYRRWARCWARAWHARGFDVRYTYLTADPGDPGRDRTKTPVGRRLAPALAWAAVRKTLPDQLDHEFFWWLRDTYPTLPGGRLSLPGMPGRLPVPVDIHDRRRRDPVRYRISTVLLPYNLAVALWEGDWSLLLGYTNLARYRPPGLPMAHAAYNPVRPQWWAFAHQPYYPNPIDWNALRTATAVGLARAIVAGERWGDMPVLADALEETGATRADVLEHCRSCTVTTPYDWALRCLLTPSEDCP